MKNSEQLEHVVRLATLTEDRTDAEQRALLRVAFRVDMELNSCTSRNFEARRGMRSSRLLREVLDTRELVDAQREVLLPDKDWQRWLRKVAEWDAAQAEIAAGTPPHRAGLGIVR